MIAALKRTRIYQRFRARRERLRQRSHKGMARSLERVLAALEQSLASEEALARSVERGLRNDDAVLRALTHLVERGERDESDRERRDEELRGRMDRLEGLIAELGAAPDRQDGAPTERPEPVDRIKEG